MTQEKSYRDTLVENIKAAGKELIDRAEQMVAKDLELITDFSIHINISTQEATEIDFTTSVISKNNADIFIRNIQ